MKVLSYAFAFFLFSFSILCWWLTGRCLAGLDCSLGSFLTFVVFGIVMFFLGAAIALMTEETCGKWD